MKRIMSVTAVVLAILMLFSVLPVAAQLSATATISTVSAQPGDTVTLSLSLSEVDDIGGINFFVQYDGTALECTGGEFAGFALDMAMASVNTAPIGREHQIVSTAMSVKPVAGNGEVVTFRFKVKEDAPAGLAVVGFTSDTQELISSSDYTPWQVQTVDGGVVVGGNNPPTTETTVDSVATTVPTAATTVKAEDPAGTTTPPTVVVVDDNGEAITRVDGQVVTLPTEGTAVDINGAVVTDTQGEPSKVQNVALIVDEVSAVAGETVTVNVTLSAVSELTFFSVNLSYDREYLAFEGGEMCGFIKENMNESGVSEPEKGYVSLMGTNVEGVSGSGTVATLRFKVHGDAKSKDCRLSFAEAPMLLTSDVLLPVQTYAGEIRIDGGANDTAMPGSTVILLVLIAVAAVMVLAVVFVKRRKGAAPAKEVPAAPVILPDVGDVSGDDME